MRSVQNKLQNKYLPFNKIALGVASLLVLSGCSTLNIDSAKLTLPEVRAALLEDQTALTRGVEPLNGPLTLDNAIARAIKYNAERRSRAMEQAVAQDNFEAGKYDMLPKLVASAGYRDRNNDLITRSTDSVTGEPSLAHPYISSERQALNSEIGISWSLLDFGQSYYAARQNADRVLIAAERHRKALNNLVQDVRSAYWRVVAAQKLLPQLRETIANSEAALKDARKAEDDRIRSPLEPLRYQRQLLENLRLLETIEQELSTGKVELAALANLPLTADYTVVEPANEVSTAWLDQPVDRMEEYALLRNPDLREGIYNARIAQQETRRALLKIFPGLSFNYGVKHSSDDYLIHKNWNEAGAQISFNLLGLLSAPAQMRLADDGVALANQRRMATQMAVLSQLHIARLQYANTIRQYERADAIAGVDSRIAQHIANQAEVQKQSALDRISQQSSAVLSQLRRYQALSNAQAAASRLQATLGMEPAIAGTATMPLDQLTVAVGQSLQRWNQGQLLVQFDCSLQQAQQAKAEAALMAADTNWKGNQKLAQLNSVGQVELDVSKAEMLKAQAEVAASRTLLGKCQISAPFAGRIAEQKTREQQYVQPGQPLMEILDDSALELEFIVPSRWLSWVRSGSAFQVNIDETGKTYPAKVQRIGAKVDPISQSVKLTAVIDGRYGELIAGMSGKVLMTPPSQK